MNKMVSLLLGLSILVPASIALASDNTYTTATLFNATSHDIEVSYRMYSCYKDYKQIMYEKTVLIKDKNSPIHFIEIKAPEIVRPIGDECIHLAIMSVVGKDINGKIFSKRNFFDLARNDFTECSAPLFRGKNINPHSENTDLVFNDIGTSKIVCQKSQAGTD